MKDDKNKTIVFRTPRGTEELFQHEAILHKYAVRKLEDLYIKNRYFPVQTPVFDFFDIYAPLMDQSMISKTYRMVDREGEVLMLRSDITLFIAKQLGTSLTKKDLPVRISYADTILRHEGQEDISRDEFFQAGIELIGIKERNADIEILNLLYDSIKIFKTPFFAIHLGSKKVFDLIFSQIDMSTKKQIKTAILLRNKRALRELLSIGGYTEEEIANIENLVMFVGDSDLFESLLTSLKLDKSIMEECKSLLKTVKQSNIPKENIKIDMSEIGINDYYSGIAFRVYMDGADSEVASGGRYDNLLRYFGLDCPAIGFSIMLRKIESLMQEKEKLLPEGINKTLKESI
ncbi:ATP phosphoribosyltransferase regulatory subunit [Spirochaetia bacterium 38H-sp]|uniref:Histidine--tRNA ligase n=1 Tax=Rarispira pelagica TaxID=3141764 RepID=A0ABU9UD51_9SPIR